VLKKKCKIALYFVDAQVQTSGGRQLSMQLANPGLSKIGHYLSQASMIQQVTS